MGGQGQGPVDKRAQRNLSKVWSRRQSLSHRNPKYTLGSPWSPRGNYDPACKNFCRANSCPQRTLQMVRRAVSPLCFRLAREVPIHAAEAHWRFMGDALLPRGRGKRLPLIPQQETKLMKTLLGERLHDFNLQEWMIYDWPKVLIDEWWTGKGVWR